MTNCVEYLPKQWPSPNEEEFSFISGSILRSTASEQFEGKINCQLFCVKRWGFFCETFPKLISRSIYIHKMSNFLQWCLDTGAQATCFSWDSKVIPTLFRQQLQNLFLLFSSHQFVKRKFHLATGRAVKDNYTFSNT